MREAAPGQRQVGGRGPVERTEAAYPVRPQPLGTGAGFVHQPPQLLPGSLAFFEEAVYLHAVDYDDRLRIETPEGVAIELTLAGLGSRLAAAVLDGLIKTGILLALIVIALVGGVGLGDDLVVGAISLLALVAITFGYDILFETLDSGRTPGKRAASIRVVRMGGQPVGFLAAAIRNLLRLVDMLPFFYAVGIISILTSRHGQRVGDLAAGTVVVRERRVTAELPPPVRAASHSALSWDVSAVTAAEVAAVRQFLERRGTLQWEVRKRLANEFADRLRPKVVGAAPDLDAEALLEELVAVKAARG